MYNYYEVVQQLEYLNASADLIIRWLIILSFVCFGLFSFSILRWFHNK